MPRTPKLRKKGGQWYTEAGASSGVYFGRIDLISRVDAQKAFLEHLRSVASTKPVSGMLSAAVLFDEFLEAAKTYRSGRTYAERKLHLDRFANFRRKNHLIGDLSATNIQADDLIKFLASLPAKYKADDFTVHKHATSIVAAFNWGAGVARLKNPNPCLPATFRPFANIERYKAPANELHEDELPTRDEVKALFTWADTDIEQMYEAGRYRSRKPEERRGGVSNPYTGFGDLLRTYYHTGARTSELADCDVRDCIHSTRTIVLGRHKRAKTLRDAAARRIALNEEAYAIVKKNCEAKKPDNPVFTDPVGRRWTRLTLSSRFQQVRKLADIRKSITIYSFRHLWISEALMSQVDIATVAKMAGTSVAMIEKVYGHFSGQHMADAQGKLDAARSAQR